MQIYAEAESRTNFICYAEAIQYIWRAAPNIAEAESRTNFICYAEAIEKTGRPSRAALHDQIVCISKKCDVSIVVERPVVFLDEIYPGLDILQSVYLIEKPARHSLVMVFQHLEVLSGHRIHETELPAGIGKITLQLGCYIAELLVQVVQIRKPYPIHLSLVQERIPQPELPSSGPVIYVTYRQCCAYIMI